MKTERKLKSSLGAPRIMEQPRRHGSSARCVRDLTTQGYWPGGFVEHVAWRQGSRLGAQDRPHCFSLHRTGRTVTTLYTPPVPHGPRGSSVQVDSIFSRVYLRSTRQTAQIQLHNKFVYLLWQYIFYSSCALAVQARSPFSALLQK